MTFKMPCETYDDIDIDFVSLLLGAGCQGLITQVMRAPLRCFENGRKKTNAVGPATRVCDSSGALLTTSLESHHLRNTSSWLLDRFSTSIGWIAKLTDATLSKHYL